MKLRAVFTTTTIVEGRPRRRAVEDAERTCE
jgi:hypothetical protein